MSLAFQTCLYQLWAKDIPAQRPTAHSGCGTGQNMNPNIPQHSPNPEKEGRATPAHTAGNISTHGGQH